MPVKMHGKCSVKNVKGSANFPKEHQIELVRMSAVEIAHENPYCTKLPKRS